MDLALTFEGKVANDPNSDAASWKFGLERYLCQRLTWYSANTFLTVPVFPRITIDSVKITPSFFLTPAHQLMECNFSEFS